MLGLRVGVVRGGIDDEYAVSLRSGATVLAHLPSHYRGQDILLARDGLWHFQGIPVALSSLAGRLDVVFNALHGTFGEDGRVQTLWENWFLPYTGSGPLPSALAMQKSLAKEIWRRHGILTPPGLQFEIADTGDETLSYMVNAIFKRLTPPYVVKPADRGSSLGVAVADTVSDLLQAIKTAAAVSGTVLAESFIAGREATCGVIEDFRGQDYYVLPTVEIRWPGRSRVWRYEDKYNGASEEICPGHFTRAQKSELARLTVLAHRLLGLRDYSRSDFIVTKRGIYLLEVNSLPGLTAASLFPQALSAVGVSLGEFIDHLVRRAVSRRSFLPRSSSAVIN